MRKLEAGCIGVPRGDGTWFSTVYDQRGHGKFCVPPDNGFPYARMVLNFSSEEEAKLVTPQVIALLNQAWEAQR